MSFLKRYQLIVYFLLFAISVVIWFLYIPAWSIYRTQMLRIRTPTQSRVNEHPPCVQLQEFLHRVEPTADFRDICDENWNNSDVICRLFCLQNGLRFKDNCNLPNHTTIVPRIVYYVIFSPFPGKPPTFHFLHYLSIKSAKKFISPWAIYVISDSPPYGYWWTRVLSDITGVRYVYRPFPVLTAKKLQYIEHASDIVRLQTLIVNGGIYLDTDMLLLNPIDHLLDHPLSMGYIDNATGMGNAFIVSERNSGFIKEWYQGYHNYTGSKNFENSLFAAKRLWLKNRTSVNEIGSMIYRPNWFESRKLLKQAGYEWRKQYAIHIWHRHGPLPENPDEMTKLNTTLGEIFRFIYYGKETMF